MERITFCFSLQFVDGLSIVDQEQYLVCTSGIMASTNISLWTRKKKTEGFFLSIAAILQEITKEEKDCVCNHNGWD